MNVNLLEKIKRMKTKYALIMTTTNTKKNAKKIIYALLKKKIAACIQLFPIESFYTWEGKVDNDKEFILFIKSKARLYNQIEKTILKKHTYTTPEIIQVPIKKGARAYFSWIEEVTK